MNPIRSITIFNPSLKEGGTSLLYFRLAKFFIENSEYKVSVVDYQDGMIARYLTTHGLPFKHIVYSPGSKVTIDEPTIFMVNLLTSKLLGDLIDLHPSACLHLLSTFQYDGFKYIPSFNIAYQWPYNYKKLWARTIHPFFYKRVKKFLEEAGTKNGLAFMDPENYMANKIIFNLHLHPTYLPIFTEDYTPVKAQFEDKPVYKLFWLGRLADFKYMTVCSMCDVLEEFNTSNKGKQFELHIIGDGSNSEDVKSYAAARKNVKTHFYGHLTSDEVNKVLLEKADIVIGHGTSILEAAKLGLPSLVLNGSYFIPKAKDLRALWLFDSKDYFLGRIAMKPEEFMGEPLITSLEKANKQYLSEQGKRSFEYWKENHSISQIGTRYLEMLGKCNFTYQNYLETGIKQLDVTGKIVKKAKKIITRT